METIYHDADDDLHCPYCNECLLSNESDDLGMCKHTLYIASDSGFERIRPDFEYEVDEEYAQYIDYDKYTEDLPLEGYRYRIDLYRGPVAYCIYFFVEHEMEGD
jgi:hypothetical protein